VADFSFTPFGERRIQNPTTAEVVQWMCRFAWDAHKNKEIRDLTNGIVSGVQKGAYTAEALAVNDFILDHIRYIRDTVGAERVSWPLETLKQRSGDCDDMATTIAGMLQSIGATCSFRLVSFTATGIPSHVFTTVETENGPIVCDPVANIEEPEMLSRITAMIVVPCAAGVDGVPSDLERVPFQGWGEYPWRK
jgi:hypothetical protein